MLTNKAVPTTPLFSDNSVRNEFLRLLVETDYEELQDEILSKSRYGISDFLTIQNFYLIEAVSFFKSSVSVFIFKKNQCCHLLES